MNREALTAAARYAFREFGVAAPQDEPIATDLEHDGFIARMMLPRRIEKIRLGQAEVDSDQRFVDAIQAGRDRLFRTTLEHMAEHDHDVAAALDAMRRSAEKRGRVVELLVQLREGRVPR